MSLSSTRVFVIAASIVCAASAYRRKSKQQANTQTGSLSDLADQHGQTESKEEFVCPLTKQKQSSPESEVFEWIQRGEIERVLEWVDECPSRVNHSERQSKMSLLHVSVIFDQSEIASALLERGANVDSLENSALTPLHLACNEGYPDCVTVLLSHGASIFSINTDSSIKLGGSIPIYGAGGQTPLHFACAAGEMQVVELLLRTPNGETLVSREDFDGNTPPMLAMLKGHTKIAHYLDPSLPSLDAAQRSAKNQEIYAIRAARISSRAGTLEALLRSGIRNKFTPRHPKLFDTSLDRDNFAPSFLTAFDTLCSSSSATSSSSSMSFGKEIAKGIYAFEFMTPAYCRWWIEEIENYEAQALEKGLPVRRPNSMNNYGLVLNDIGFAPVVDALRTQFLQPIMQGLFPDLASQIRNHHTFAVKYKLGEDLDLGTHVDNSLITVNLSLGKSFKGGTLYFHGVADQNNAEPHPYNDNHKKQCKYCELEYDHKPGVAVIHVGKHIHGANQLLEGERVNLIVWFQP